MLNFLFYIASFAVLLGVLIVVHEYGHFRVARLCGVKVLTFCVGFGKPIYSKKIGETEWAIAAFPLGGYVKMLDEREGEVLPHELHRAFNTQTVGKRIAIVAAGPIANLLLAFVIYAALFMWGVSEPRAILGMPTVNSAAAIAGVQNGDIVQKVGTDKVQSIQEFNWRLLENIAKNDLVRLEVENAQHEIHTRTINAAQIKAESWQGDTLDKLGFSFFEPIIPAEIGEISPDSPAAKAGLLAGDLIVSINNQAISDWRDLLAEIKNSPNKEVRLVIEREIKSKSVFVRDPETLTFEIIPNEFTLPNGDKIGRIGVMAKAPNFDNLSVTIKYGFFASFQKAASEVVDKSVFSLKMIGKMILGEVSWRTLGGPIQIADYAGQTAKMGATQYLLFMALVSISLGVLNLLPIPILDGGHLLYYLAEILLRRPLPEKFMEMGQKVGMFLLMTLMAFAFYNDISRFFSG